MVRGSAVLCWLTPSIASFTRASLISPPLKRFSTNSVFVEPEQYHAIEWVLFSEVDIENWRRWRWDWGILWRYRIDLPIIQWIGI